LDFLAYFRSPTMVRPTLPAPLPVVLTSLGVPLPPIFLATTNLVTGVTAMRLVKQKKPPLVLFLPAKPLVDLLLARPVSSPSHTRVLSTRLVLMLVDFQSHGAQLKWITGVDTGRDSGGIVMNLVKLRKSGDKFI